LAKNTNKKPYFQPPAPPSFSRNKDNNIENNMRK